MRATTMPKYVDGIASIVFRMPDDEPGCVRIWGIGCDAGGLDSPETLRKHLAKWIPKAEFVGVEIKPVRKYPHPKS